MFFLGYKRTANLRITLSVLSGILFDLIGQGILDGIYIVSRAVVLSCFFTVNPPWLSGLCFLTFHLTTAFLLMYHAGPAAVNEFTPDFRLILYNRTNHPDIITAAVASLVFPPLMNIHFKEGKERFYHPWLSSASRTFWIAAMLLMLETEAMMLFWVRLNSDHVPSHARTLTMAVITGAMIFVLLGHVLYVTFIYIPFKRREQLKCCRNHGKSARSGGRRFSQTVSRLKQFACIEIYDSIQTSVHF